MITTILIWIYAFSTLFTAGMCIHYFHEVYYTCEQVVILEDSTYNKKIITFKIYACILTIIFMPILNTYFVYLILKN